MAFDTLLLERDGAVAIVTINRSKVLNALNAQALDELRPVVLDLTHDDSVRAMILTGAGEKSFVAGADTARLGQPELFGLVASTDDMREGTAAFLDTRKPQFEGR